MPRSPASFRGAVGYAWALPNTLVGLLGGLLVLAFGGRLRVVRGVAEFSGGGLGAACAALPPVLRYSAITLGHVVLGVSAAELAAVRDHEHVHVRQYERWGPLFLPAYACSSLWQLLRGRRAYRDNIFERRAYAEERPAGGEPIPPAAGSPASVRISSLRAAEP